MEYKVFFFFSSRRRHTRWPRDWSSDVCSSDLRPRRGVPGVVRERGDRLAEALVARPAEVDGVVLAGLLGDRHGAGEGGDRVGAVVAWAAVAPLGEHLGGVGPTRPWQRREDLGVRVLTQVGGHATVEVLDRGVEGAQDPD